LLVSATAATRDIAATTDDLDRHAIFGIIHAGDCVDALGAAIGGCWSYAAELDEELLKETIRHSRVGSLELCLARITFPKGRRERDEVLTDLLVFALESGRIYMADRLLNQRFTIDRSRYGFFAWPKPWNTDHISGYIAGHRQHAAGLAPTPADFARIRDEEEGLQLVALARYCASMASNWWAPMTLEATALLGGLMENEKCSDAVMAVVADKLLLRGARLDQEHFEVLEAGKTDHGRCIEKTKQVLQNHSYYKSLGQIS
jgi:hypothetical protein